MSNLNSLLGFGSKGAKNSGAKNAVSSTNALSGAAPAKESNYAQAMRLLQIQRGVQRAVAGFSPQARIISTLAVTILIGGPIYSFIEDPRVQIGFMLFFSLAVLLMVWGLMETRQLKWGMITAWATGTGIWMYVFYQRLETERVNDRVGKVAYICSPTSRCKNDGWWGPYNGTKPYVYQDPHTNKKTGYIPGINFKNTIPNKFTYSFWLRVDYEEWSKPDYRTNPSPVIVKGGSTQTAVPAVFIDPSTNVIQFQVTPLMARKVEVVTVNYPFDKWVHYTLVAYKDSIEIYVNGLLRKTKILKSPISVTRSPMYIGTVPEDSGSDKGFMPGELLFLEYYNKSMTADEVDKLYKDQRSKMMTLPSPEKLGDAEEEAKTRFCKKCPEKCGKKGESKTKKLMGANLSNADQDRLMVRLGIKDPDGKPKSKKVPTIDTSKYSVSNVLPGGMSKDLGLESFVVNDTSDTSADYLTETSVSNCLDNQLSSF